MLAMLWKMVMDTTLDTAVTLMNVLLVFPQLKSSIAALELVSIQKVVTLVTVRLDTNFTVMV
jgi:hypothetical protein